MDDIIKGLEQALRAAKSIRLQVDPKATWSETKWEQAHNDFEHGLEMACRGADKMEILPHSVFVAYGSET
jgi:hypothetical protein